MKKKTVALLMSLVLIFGVAVGGTIAWLMDTTKEVVNVFTVGDIEITLEETTEDYKIIPGTEIAKDPKVTVLEKSEDCWLFVTIAKENWNDNLTYELAAGWIELEEGVYYREVTSSDEKQPFDVLANNKVVVDGDLTSAEMETMETAQPTLTFRAFAIQKNETEIPDAAAAWALVKDTPVPTT